MPLLCAAYRLKVDVGTAPWHVRGIISALPWHAKASRSSGLAGPSQHRARVVDHVCIGPRLRAPQ